MSKIRVGVIGAGSWAVASHLPNLARDKDIEFVGICRKGPELLQKIKNDFGFKVASENYQDVLDAGIDICIVGSPTGLHHEHAMAALKAGAHVMCEKPVTIDPRQAWELDDYAKALNKHLIIAFGWNYLPMLERAKELMLDKGIGNLEQMSISMSSQCRELLSNTGSYPDAAPELLPEQTTWTDPRISGGGYGQAQLSHALGMGLWLTDSRVASGFAMMSAALAAPVELHNAITYSFDNGAIGVVAGGSSHVKAHRNVHALELRAIGDRGQLLVDIERATVWFYDGNENIELSLDEKAGTYNCDGPIAAIIKAAKGESFINQSPGHLGARTVEALDIAYRSAASGTLEHRKTYLKGTS